MKCGLAGLGAVDLDVAALAGKPDLGQMAKGQGLRCSLCLCGEWPNQEFLSPPGRGGRW